MSAPAPWLQHYAEGVPALLEPLHVSPLAHIRAAVARAPDSEALRYFDASISYGRLDALSDGLALWLAEQGVRQGDRVAIILQNVPHLLVAVIAAWKIGAIPVPGNPMYTAAELARIFADYEPSAAIGHVEGLAGMREALAVAKLDAVPVASVDAHDFQTLDDPRLLPPRGTIGDAPDLLAICTERQGRAPARFDPGADDIGLILYTSGTTGVPKGAVIRHSSLAFNGEQGAQWMEIGPDSRILALAPFFHITGFVLHMCVAFAGGASMGVQYRFQAEAVLDVIRAYRPTSSVAAITAYNALMNAPGVSHADFACFANAFTGGAPVAPALRGSVKARLGLSLLPAYGMTETGAQTHLTPVGATPPVHPETGALAIGVPVSSTEAMIADEHGNPVPPGVQGEIWMRGPQIMVGYWNKPEESARTLAGGWMHSGDIGVMDEAGWFYVVDRQKDMIIASGFKVWPREVEDVLLSHPAVREAAVVGAPCAYRGETVVAFVSTVAGGDCCEADLVGHCREALAAYKVPRKVVLLDELPKTPTGKIQRAVMREQVREG